MHTISVGQLVPVLQTAIGPVILISGVGLLLLTMTNRLGRAIDKARTLSTTLQTANQTAAPAIIGQLRIFWKRARLIRLAITLASMSALSAAVLIILLFFTALWSLETGWLIAALFITCMVCLISSLGVFIHDINQSLAALKMELALDGIDQSQR